MTDIKISFFTVVFYFNVFPNSVHRVLVSIFFMLLYSLGDIQYDLEEAAHVRAKLLKIYESVDIIRWVHVWVM